jgi:hypothetical protein
MTHRDNCPRIGLAVQARPSKSPTTDRRHPLANWRPPRCSPCSNPPRLRKPSPRPRRITAPGWPPSSWAVQRARYEADRARRHFDNVSRRSSRTYPKAGSDSTGPRRSSGALAKPCCTRSTWRTAGSARQPRQTERPTNLVSSDQAGLFDTPEQRGGSSPERPANRRPG